MPNGIREIHELLWPPEDPDRQWDAGTIEKVAEIVKAHMPQIVAAEENQDGELFCTGCLSTTFRYEESVSAWRRMAHNGHEGDRMLIFYSESDEGDGDDDPGVVCEECGKEIELPDDWNVDWAL